GDGALLKRGKTRRRGEVVETGGEKGRVVAIVVVGLKEVAARGGEWHRGSYRSGGGEHFWGSPKKSPETAASGGDGGQRVSEQKGTTKGTSMNTQFCKQSILEKPPCSSKPKLYAVTHFLNSKGLPKIDETRALSKPVTSNSILTPQESKVMKNDKKLKANVSNTENQKKQNPKVMKPKKVGSNERLASPKPSKPRSYLRWSPTGRLFDLKGKIIASSEYESQSDCSNGDNAYNANPLEPTIKQFPNSTSFLGSDLQWGNVLITRVYFVEGLGHNLFSVGQFCNSDLEVAFGRNKCFVRNLEGVDPLKGNRTTNLYTINLYDMASASSICLMARATSTKSWLWHQRLSHLNFDIINDLAKNDLVTGLPKFKYHKEHLCPSCEQRKRKRASHPPKPVPNSKQRLHLLYMDLCGPMRIASINGKRYVLVIVDDYSCYTWVHFLISKDEAPKYKFPLPVKVVATIKRIKMPLPEVCIAIEEKKKKLPVKDRWQLH
nr:retrovirus-related Pol polyprotein from transposon TNT 1-94 [Tanacetum cinerariifolium]